MNISKELAEQISASMRSRNGGMTLEVHEIEEIASNFDTDALTKEMLASMGVEKWDRKSPINGVPADEVLAARDDIPKKGVIYLITQNGRVLYFQPHKPSVAGNAPLTEGNWEEIANEHLKQIVNLKVEEKFGQLLQDRLIERIKNGR